MIISEAKQIITDKLVMAAERLKEKELLPKMRCYFTDASFIESADITEKSRIIFGELSVSAEGLDEGEECIFVICAELSAGEVSEEELATSIEEFESELLELEGEISSLCPVEALRKITEKQQKEADAAAEEMMAELRSARKKLFWGIGAIVAIIAVIIIVGSII